MALAGLLALYRSDDTDYWFHLAAGRSIAAHGLPAQESWCLAAQGQRPWLSEWLFHLALFTTRSLGGDAAVALWRGAWAAGAMALVLALGRSLGAASWSAALLAPLVLAAVRGRLQPRPEELASVFILLSLLLFEHARRAGKDRTSWLVVAQVLWANLHPSWVFGPAIAWLYALTTWRRPGSPHESTAPARRWAALGLGLWAASAFTPQPLETLAVPFRFLADLKADPLTSSIEELHRWSWRMDAAQPFTALLALFVLVTILRGRRAFQASPPLAIAAIASLGLGMLAVRFRALAAWVTLAPLASALAPAGSRAGRWLGLGLAGAAGAAGAAWLVLAPGYTPGNAPQLRSVPARAAAVAESLQIEGPVLNTFHYGGYLLWVRGEAHPPLIDGRARGSAGFRSRYARANSEPAAMDSLIMEWHFTHAVLEPPQHPADRMAVELAGRREWALIFADDAALLFVRREIYPALAETRGYHWLTPDYEAMSKLLSRALKDPELAQAIAGELERSRRESPWRGRATFWLALLGLAKGRTAEAVKLMDEVERLAPRTPGLAIRQGMARQKTGDIAGARAAYRRALREPQDAAAARQALEALR